MESWHAMKKQARERRIRELERLMYQFKNVPSIAKRYAEEYNKLVEERKKAEDEQKEYIEKKRREEGE
jgi:DNA primase large subunit